jgi:hypothetical protein
MLIISEPKINAKKQPIHGLFFSVSDMKWLLGGEMRMGLAVGTINNGKWSLSQRATWIIVFRRTQIPLRLPGAAQALIRFMRSKTMASPPGRINKGREDIKIHPLGITLN